MNYRKASSAELRRIGEIDRAESITATYHCVLSPDGYAIEMRRAPLSPPEVVPDWDAHGIQRRVAWWTREVDEGGALFLAEDERRLRGFAVLGPQKSERSAEMVALFVDRQARGQGVGKELVQMLEAEVRRRQLKCVFVQSNGTESSVEFYRAVGYVVVGLMDPTILHLPMLETSIILAKRLD